MKSLLKIWWAACVLTMIILAGNAFAGKKVVVVTGVDEVNTKRIGAIQPVFEGIREGIKGHNIDLEFLYTELVEVDDAVKEGIGASAVARAMAHNPELVITLTDDGLKYVGSKIRDVPVVFAWIWNNPTALGLPRPNITGVIRGSHAIDIWVLARELSRAKTVTMLSKDNESMQGAKQYLENAALDLQRVTGVKLMDVQLVDTFRDWADRVKKCRSEMIYLADTSRVDRNGPMKDEDLVRWTVDNSPVPVIAGAEKDVRAGALLAVVSSDKDMGLRAAETAVKILNGAKPSDIPYVKSTKGSLVINTRTARKYGIHIPEDVLSSAAKLYNE